LTLPDLVTLNLFFAELLVFNLGMVSELYIDYFSLARLFYN